MTRCLTAEAGADRNTRHRAVLRLAIVPGGAPYTRAMGLLVVTGANGFVGRHLVAVARARGIETRGIVRSEAGARVVAAAGGQPGRSVALSPGSLEEHFDGAATVCHLAGIGSERSGGHYEEAIVGVTQRVARAARSAGVSRVIYFSGLGVASYGRTRRATNRYFLSKLAAELVLFQSGLEVVVFRPSYIVGSGGELIGEIAAQLGSGRAEVVDEGKRRLQPIAVADAADAILAASTLEKPWPAVVDLVGPEPVSQRELVARIARVLGLGSEFRTESIDAAEADRRAADGGYMGMGPEELDCLLSDEVAGPGPLESLLGRSLQGLDVALAAALRPARPA